MVRPRKWLGKVAVVLLLEVTLAPIAARAEVDGGSRASARQLGYEGVELYQSGNYEGASERLERAYQVLRVPSIGLWSARALAKLGKLVEASERYLEIDRLEVSGDAAIQNQAKRDAASEREGLLPRVPSIIVRVEGEGAPQARVSIDGVEVPAALLGAKRPVNPGSHQVVGEAGEIGARAEQEVSLGEGQTQEVTLVIARGAAAESPSTAQGRAPAAVAGEAPAGGSSMKTVGWVLLGVGAAGLVTSGVTAGLALSSKSSMGEDCRDGQCLPSAHGDVDGYNSLRTISTVGFFVGVAGAAGGATLLLMAPKSGNTGRHATPYLGLTGGGVRGSF